MDGLFLCRKIRWKKSEIIKGPVDVGEMGKYIVIKDPTGAYCALWEKA